MKESRRRMGDWPKDYWAPVLIFAVTFLCYLPSLHHDFVFDDTWLVIENPYIKSWRQLSNMLTQDAWNVWDRHNYWRPVFLLSLALDYSLWGLKPLGFHLTNILIHALSAGLLSLLGQRLQGRAAAATAALIFALHPLQAHAVNVVSVRGELLAGLFTLLALHGFLSGRCALLGGAVALALLSKETSAVLPFALLLAAFLVEGRAWDARISVGFIILALYLGARMLLGFGFSVPASVLSYDAGFGTRSLLALKTVSLYSLALVNLFEPPRPFWSVELPVSWADPHTLAGTAIVATLAGAFWLSIRPRPIAAFGLAWFMLYLFPVSNLKELNQPMAEHWLYLPIIGLALAVGAAIPEANLLPARARLLRISLSTAMAIYLVLAALVTRVKTGVYRSDRSFLLAAVRANPRVGRLQAALASTYLADGDLTKAAEHYAKSLELDPDDLVANYRMGYVLHKTGERERANYYLERVARSSPARLSEIMIVAQAWEMLGNKEAALSLYRKALAVHPESAWVKKKLAALGTRPK